MSTKRRKIRKKKHNLRVIEDLPPEIVAHIRSFFNKKTLIISKWYHDQKYNCEEKLINLIVKNGNLILLQWAINQGIKPTLKTHDWTAIKGHIHISEFLLTLGIKFDRNTASCAARHSRKNIYGGCLN